MALEDRTQVMEKLASLGKRKGFIFRSSEIYGGLGSTWDYGPLGVELKRAVMNAWWTEIVSKREDVVGMDAAILMNPEVWKASGHVGSFQDPLVECNKCNRRFRQDHVEGEACPECGGELSEPRMFNLMFKTFIGPVEDDSSVAYLRPETAQGIFVNFRNVQEASRQKIPFGIAQLGKAFRNEITVGNFTFRSREFEQMELEWFCHPDEADKWFEFWLDARFRWYESLGVKKERLRLRPHEDDELAHYAKARTSNTSSRSAGRSWRGSPTVELTTWTNTWNSAARISATSIRTATSAMCRSLLSPPAVSTVPFWSC